MIKLIFNLLLIIVVVLLQISILQFIYPFSNLNLALIIIIFIELMLSQKISLYWAIIIGLIYDSYSLASPFPFMTTLLILVIFLIRIFMANLVNVKSFLHYLLFVLVGTLFFDLILFLFKYITSDFFIYFNLENFAWVNLLWQILLNLVVFCIFLTCARVMTAKFNLRQLF